MSSVMTNFLLSDNTKWLTCDKHQIEISMTDCLISIKRLKIKPNLAWTWLQTILYTQFFIIIYLLKHIFHECINKCYL